MLSYNQWKNLNESVLGTTNLGLVNPQNLGITGEVQSMTEAEILEEMKKRINEARKKLRKKMGAEGDGEFVPPAAKKDADPDADKEAEDDSESAPEDSEEGEEEAPKKPAEEEGDKEDDEESEDDFDAEEEGDDAGSAKEMMMKKGCKKMKKGGKSKVKKEDTAWYDSVMSMLSPENVNQKHWDGLSPAPGEPGFAPAGRIGQ